MRYLLFLLALPLAAQYFPPPSGGGGAPSGPPGAVQTTTGSAFQGYADFVWNETPTITGMTGLLLGSPEPDLSCCNGPANTLTLIPNGQVQATFYSGGDAGGAIGVYNSGGTAASPSDFTFASDLFDWDFYVYSGGQFNEYLFLGPECSSLTACTYETWVNGGQFTFVDNNNGTAQFGLHAVAAGEAAITTGATLSDPNPALAQLDLANIIVDSQAATTGEVFACISTTGQITASATACVGTL
jgi:hypothetical protein